MGVSTKSIYTWQKLFSKPATYGNIVSVYVGPDKTITALTDDGIEELTDMIRAARITKKTWHEFLDDFVEDTDLAARIKAKSPR
ncbi:hypothetical protein ACEN2J_07840 [Pseudorhodobacter sp. W20_MBD10_FR17]|uniref:hypothetical protein n=1 Tax=Pseudorhodobacter sp. W20_MBD10_FR17 TaxID=3240266 RepID=UPI003F99BEDD